MRDPDALRYRAGVRGDPDRDQHFLVDDRVLDRLPGYLPENADRSHVLEIGAGTGALTDRLLTESEFVTAIERDPELAAFLRDEFAHAIAEDRLSIVEGDALEVELPEISASVSNLPYGASSEFIFRLLPLNRPLVLMVQLEFAERMAAEPGTDDYGRLSVTAGHYANVEIVETVPPQAFSPQPAVDSAIVRATPSDPPYDLDDQDLFFSFVRAVFTQRRKTMRNAIRNTTHISGIDDADAVVDAAPSSLLDKRAGAVTPREYASLTALAADVGLDR